MEKKRIQGRWGGGGEIQNINVYSNLRTNAEENATKLKTEVGIYIIV